MQHKQKLFHVTTKTIALNKNNLQAFIYNSIRIFSTVRSYIMLCINLLISLIALGADILFVYRIHRRGGTHRLCQAVAYVSDAPHSDGTTCHAVLRLATVPWCPPATMAHILCETGAWQPDWPLTSLEHNWETGFWSTSAHRHRHNSCQQADKICELMPGQIWDAEWQVLWAKAGAGSSGSCSNGRKW